MQLKVLERLLLLSLIPREGSYLTLRVVSDLRRELAFSEEELAALQFEELPGGGTRWSDEVDATCIKDIDIGDAATKIICDSLKKLNDEEKLTTDHLTLWDKFMEKGT